MSYGHLMSDPRDETMKHRGACRHCGSTREQCDKRLMVYPKRCCTACKESGPALNHDD